MRAACGLTGEEVARLAGYWLVRVPEPGRINVRGDILEVGPDALPSELASIGCRRELSEIGVHSEDAVRESVESLGFLYVAQRRPFSSARSDVWAKVG